MKSEDIARYVAGLEGEVERLRTVQQEVESERDSARSLARSALAFLDVDTTPGKRPCGSEEPGEPCDCDLDSSPLADAPDTSRVTFGCRHKGTGMVLLQHADAMCVHTVYGDDPGDTAEWHRSCSINQKIDAGSRSIHVALAEVREALNTAEADGVDVEPDGRIHVRDSKWGIGKGITAPDPNVPDSPDVEWRVSCYLANEVKAFVDQGLRGDDLNARVPYRVTDHRAPVEAADTSSDDGMRVEEDRDQYRVYCDALDPSGRPVALVPVGFHNDGRSVAQHVADAVEAHRAARTSEGEATNTLIPGRTNHSSGVQCVPAWDSPTSVGGAA